MSENNEINNRKQEGFWKSMVAWIQSWKWKKIVRVFGLVLVVLASLKLVSRIILFSLILIDPKQLGEIIAAFSGRVNIFEYISLSNYYPVVGGVILMNLVFWVAVLLLGVLLWKKRNLFIRDRLWVWLVGIFLLGASTFACGLYYTLPKLQEPLMKLQDRHGGPYGGSCSHNGRKKEMRPFGEEMPFLEGVPLGGMLFEDEMHGFDKMDQYLPMF